MKKKHGNARALDPLGREALETLSTGALLARLERLRWCEESFDKSDMSDEEFAAVAGKIVLKDTDAWRRAYREVKAILDGREHVSRSVKSRT
jgi:hypothetical protein